ncbi:MAG TPA: TonB-dependent receptor [Steroidobacteraceae bacterium]|jgi:iron complex outermembrane receptor protein|nr:TonB-dependent receptor [Steroidobacteraceae bacterium]
MKTNTRLSVLGGALLPAALLLPHAASAQNADIAAEPVQQVTITGTYIRRSEGFTPASPVAELSREQFEAHAPKTVADFLTQLPYSFNTQFTVGRALGSSNGSGSLNLRNLGPDATLVLLNSRRAPRDAVTMNNVDVNSLVPQIAIERIEILKDGASSLYGSDAVGGVANFITRHKFDGFEVQALGDMREIGSTIDGRFGAIWGQQSDSGGIVVAAEYFKRSPFPWESYELHTQFNGAIDGDFRASGWPARFTIPNRNAAGAIAGPATTIADPDCSKFTAQTFVTGAPVTRLGVTYPSGCQQNLPWGTNANADETRYQGFIELHKDFSPSLRFFGEAGLLRTRDAIVDTPGAAVNPGPGQPPVIIPGYAPSNTFRAMDSAGVPLYAESSGVRLGYDKDGVGGNDFLPARDASGRVIVAGTDPNAVGSNGLPVVPFWEDVTVANGSRIFGLNCNLPGDPTTTRNCRETYNTTRYEVNANRFLGGFEGDLFGGDNWHYTVSYLYAENNENDTTFGSSFSMPALRAALAGFGGSGCLSPSNDPLQSGSVRPGSGNCQFFNIFGSSVTTSPGSLLANTPDMVLYVTAQDWQRFKSKLQVADVVLSGNVFKLPAGEVGLAIGAQQRREGWSADYPQLQNAGQSDLQAAFFDKNVHQTANAVFAELNVPLVDSGGFGKLDFAGAVRTENTEGPGLKTTDPKLGLLYTIPGDWLRLRGTWSTSFLAPSLYQRYRQNVVFTNSVDDVLTPAIDNIARVTTLVSGSPVLKPQSSRNYNFGFTLAPIRTLNVDVDYWHFTFSDQIALENPLELAQSLTTTLDPTKVLRDPNAGTVIYNGVNVGPIVGFNTTYVNTRTVETAGIDVGISNTLDLGRAGALRSSLSSTYQSTYKINGRDFTRSRNARVAGGSFAVPWRATLQNMWLIGNSSVQSLLRYTDGYLNDQIPNAGTPVKPYVEPYVSWDVSYAYSFGERFGLKGSDVAFGVNNVMDKVPPYVPDGNHTLSSMYDYSGRHFWLRLKAQF